MNDQYLIEEKPLKALFIFSLPMLIGNFFQQTYTMVDSMVVGRYVSENAMAAIGACYSFTNIFIWFAVGGGIGASVIVSRLFGAHDYRQMRSATRTALLAFLMISIFLGILGYGIEIPVLKLLRTPEEVLSSCCIYLNIYFLGLPFLFMYNVISSMFNAMGNSKIPLYFLIFSSVLNIILDIWFVLRFHMGIAGVAWATLIAQGISALASGYVLIMFFRKQYPVDGHVPLFDRKLGAEMARIALPSILQQSTVSIGMMVVQSVVNTFGAQALAGYSVGLRIENYCCVPWSAFNSAISAYIAQNIGAGKKERVRQGYRAVNMMILICAIIFFLILEPLAGPIVRLFLGGNISQTAWNVGKNYIRCDGIFIGILGVKMAVDGALRGCEDTLAFTIANLVNLGLRIIIAFTLAPIFGIQMVWLANPVGWSANWIISHHHFRKTSYYGGKSHSQFLL